MPATLPENRIIAGGARGVLVSGSIASGTVVSSRNLWVQESPDAVSKAKSDFASWLKRIEESEGVFERFVYNNPNLSDLDLIQHRGRIYRMLADGEDLVVTFALLSESLDAVSYFKLIQENINNLLSKLNAWHGPLDAQEDIPDDFKEGMRDIAAGKIVDLDEALAKTPSADAV